MSEKLQLTNLVALRALLLSEMLEWRNKLNEFRTNLPAPDHPQKIKAFAALPAFSQTLNNLNAAGIALQKSSDDLRKTAEDQIRNGGNLTAFAQAFLVKDNGLLNWLFPAVKPRREIGELYNAMTKLTSNFSKTVFFELEAFRNATSGPHLAKAVEILRSASDNLQEIINQLDAFLPAEALKNIQSTRVTPIEIRVARWGLAASLVVALFTSILAYVESREARQNLNETSKKELFSEYKIRLGQINSAAYFAGSFSQTNLIKTTPRQILLIALNGQAHAKDTRLQLSCDRIIRDLDQRYDVKNNADEAAQAVFDLRHFLENAQTNNPCLVTNDIAALKNFSAVNGF